MRITTHFKDYYDGLQNQAFDSDLLYVRKPVEIASPHQWPYAPVPAEYQWVENVFQHTGGDVVVALCGKLYRGKIVNVEVKVPVFDKKPGDFYIRNERKFIWSSDVYAKWKSTQPVGKTARYGKKVDPYETYFNPVHEKSVEDLMIEHKIPILIRSIEDFSKYYTINGNLGRIDFQKVMPPAQAYQELSMFLGNLAPENKPMVQIEDKYKIAEHGFDKWSFRKQGKNGV